MGAAYFVLLVALIFTFVAFNRVHKSIEISDQNRFENVIAQTRAEIQRRLVRCVDQIYNTRALFAVKEDVTLDDWRTYFETMSLRHNILGIRSIVYVERVTPANREEFLKYRSGSIRTNFTIIPPGERATYYPIVYVTHFDPWAQIIYGLDHAVLPERLETIEQSVDQNAALMTVKTRFMTTDGGFQFHTNGGFMVYLPIYKNGSTVTNVTQRRAALQGLVSMTIVPQVMLTAVFEEEGLENSGVGIEVFEGPSVNRDKAIYAAGTTHASGPNSHASFSRQIIMPVLNREWTFSFVTTPKFDAASPRFLQWLTLFSGISMSFLLFGIAWTQVKARARVEAGEAALAIEKQELAVTLFSIGDGVITTDTDAKVVLINKAAQSLTGWAQKEACGKPLTEVFQLIHEHSREPTSNPVNIALRTGETVELGNHVILVSRDGNERAIADSAAPIRDEAGNVSGVVLVFRDVTEKQRLEAQMVKESKLESVGLLAGGIAHDFNNMLTCIMGNISLSRMEATSPDERAQLLHGAEKAAIRAKDLTQQLLTFAKGGEPIKKPMALEPLVREACDFAFRGSNVHCQFSSERDISGVEIDEGQFRQVLNNLVINARQAMPDGGKVDVRLQNIEIAIGAMPPLPSGKYVKISVMDRGVGIKRELLPRIFEPYFTTKKGGCGLGLATAYSIISKHDGLIKVESTVGAGSTFQIFLPATSKHIVSLPQELRQTKFSGSGRILIMDDEVAVLKTVGAMLQKFGYEVETALDGAEAIRCYTTAMAGGNRFAAVIMDLTVPNGMGGLDAVKRLLEFDSRLRAIVSSGYSLDPVMANHREYGFVGVIQKPYRSEDLGRVLQEVIEEGASATGESRPVP